MSLHLVTGYAGSAHITSEDQGAFNASIVGTGEYVLPNGSQFDTQVISNNKIRILDGDISMQGRHITLKKDTFEEVEIANGLLGLNRNDLIVVRYTKDANTGVENTVFAVIQGVSTDATASDPAYTTGDIFSGECLLHEMPLYRVPLSGLNVGTLVPLFNVMSNLSDMNDKIDECFQSVSDGKSLVASAITDKGVTTAQDATFETMAENIGLITTIPSFYDSEATEGNFVDSTSVSHQVSCTMDLAAENDYILIIPLFLNAEQGGSYGSNVKCSWESVTFPEGATAELLYEQNKNGYYLERVYKVHTHEAGTVTAVVNVSGYYTKNYHLDICALA